MEIFIDKHTQEIADKSEENRNSRGIFQRLKRSLTFTLGRTQSSFFEYNKQEPDSCSSTSDEVEVQNIISQKGMEARKSFGKRRSVKNQSFYHSPLERCIISREKRLIRKASFDNYSMYFNKSNKG